MPCAFEAMVFFRFALHLPIIGFLAIFVIDTIYVSGSTVNYESRTITAALRARHAAACSISGDHAECDSGNHCNKPSLSRSR